MRFWTFVDRNWFWLCGFGIVVVCAIADCGAKHPEGRASGCGVSIAIGSGSSDGGSE